MSKIPSGVILYRGPSSFNGAPIVVIATGLVVPRKGKENVKTGPMIQTYILLDRADWRPVDFVKSGDDVGICGTCIHAGNKDDDGKLGSCYVNQGQGPGAVADALHRGMYPRYNPVRHARYLRGRNVRFGTYGDPAAAPLQVWRRLAKLAANHTGYTHAWRTCAPEFSGLVMASVETELQRLEAHRLGYRTFRVRLADQPLSRGEIVCPASAEGGKRRTCDTCKACSGQTESGRGADVAIIFHSSPLGGNWKLRKYEKTMAELLAAEASAPAPAPTRRVALNLI